MSERLETKVAQALQAAGITSTTEFIWTPVTSVVLVLLDGMTEPLLLKRLERVKGDGGEFVSFFAAKTRFGRTRALNWRSESTFPSFQWESGERVDIPFGVYAIKAETNRALELFGKNLGSEHERRVNAALRDMLITVEYDAFFGRHDPAASRFEMDGLQTLIPSSNVVTLNESLLTYDAVVEAARIVRSAGGIPRELYASTVDIANLSRELARNFGIGPEGQAKWLTGELPIPTPFGNIKPIAHPLFPSTGNRYAFVIDPDTPTDDGPSIHLRYLGDEMPLRIDLPGADLTIAQGFLWIVALAVPGRYWQAAISIVPPAGGEA